MAQLIEIDLISNGSAGFRLETRAEVWCNKNGCLLVFAGEISENEVLYAWNAS
jgi:hypothetical protein